MSELFCTIISMIMFLFTLLSTVLDSKAHGCCSYLRVDMESGSPWAAFVHCLWIELVWLDTRYSQQQYEHFNLSLWQHVLLSRHIYCFVFSSLRRIAWQQFLLLDFHNQVILQLSFRGYIMISSSICSPYCSFFFFFQKLTEDGESDEQVVLVSQSGTVNRIKVRDISIQSRYAR